jgi:hypothetical protein
MQNSGRVHNAGGFGLPVATIIELLDDTDERVGEGAAANPGLPPETMRLLLNPVPHFSARH